MNRLVLSLIALAAGTSFSIGQLTVEKAAEILDTSVSGSERMGALSFLRRNKEKAAPAIKPLARILTIGPNSKEARWAWETLAGAGSGSVESIAQVAASGFDSAYIAGWVIRRYPAEVEEELLPLLADVKSYHQLVALRHFKLSPEAADAFFKDAFNNGGYYSRLWPALMVGDHATDPKIIAGIRKHPWVMMKYLALRLEEEWRRRDSPDYQRLQGPRPKVRRGLVLPPEEAKRRAKAEAALKELAEGSMGQAMEQFRRAHGSDSRFLHLMFIQYLSKHAAVPKQEMIELIDLSWRDPGTRLDLLLLEYRKKLLTELRKEERAVPRPEVQSFASLEEALRWLDTHIEAKDIDALIDIQAKLTHNRPMQRTFIHKMLRERPQGKLVDLVKNEDLPEGAEKYQLGGKGSLMGSTKFLFVKEKGRWLIERIHPFN